MWPNHANRTAYPLPIVTSAPPITKPTPLSQDTFDRYTLYVKEHEALTEKKQALDDKTAKLGKELDTAEGVKGYSWTRKDHGLIRRLTAECATLKLDRIALEKKLDTLVGVNATLVSLVSGYESCVKGYEDYLAWKEETNRQIHETFAKTE
jgi:hypothetical protein